MPVEVRYIAFGPKEITAILGFGLPRLNLPKPKSVVTTCAIDEDRVRFEFADAPDPADEALTLSLAQTSACVLFYCKSRNIPVAQRMKKRLDVVGGSLVLVLSEIDRPGSASLVMPSAA